MDMGRKKTTVVFVHVVCLITAALAARYGLYTATFPHHIISPFAQHPCTASSTVFGNNEFTRTLFVAMLLDIALPLPLAWL
jgi:hypothetical protein